MQVLLVDDDHTALVFHGAILRRAGYTVRSAAGGAEALKPSAMVGIDMVVLDSRMPGVDGLCVLRMLRARGFAGPIIMLTGAADTDDLVAGLDGGADDYIVKPANPRELTARVRALLRKHRPALDRSTRCKPDDPALLARVASVIESRSFSPVFQPIVRMMDRGVVAYEALTRFIDGRAPDQHFAEAHHVGLGKELALVTLRESLRGAREFPSGTALHVNVDPPLLGDADVALVLRLSDRPLVVEITEHSPIEDYPAASRHLEALGPTVRLAVDDAGAGYSSLRHIVALRPHEVKLDRQWVERIDADPGRRALISGLVTFARATGTVLVAEGVEQEVEADVLCALGVDHAQGYLFGRPAPIETWQQQLAVR